MLVTALSAAALPTAEAWTCVPDPQDVCKTVQQTAYPVVGFVVGTALDAVEQVEDLLP